MTQDPQTWPQNPACSFPRDPKARSFDSYKGPSHLGKTRVQRRQFKSKRGTEFSKKTTSLDLSHQSPLGQSGIPSDGPRGIPEIVGLRHIFNRRAKQFAFEETRASTKDRNRTKEFAGTRLSAGLEADVVPLLQYFVLHRKVATAWSQAALPSISFGARVSTPTSPGGRDVVITIQEFWSGVGPCIPVRCLQLVLWSDRCRCKST